MKRKAIILLMCVVCGFAAMGQNLQKMHSYDFNGALSEYRDSLENCTDSLRMDAFLKAAKCAENGISLTGYCHQPIVIARRRFHKDEFFLYYPLQDKAWHPVQNDTLAVVYDVSGVKDTLCLARKDSLLLYPMVCGEDRYFASQDLYGMGGYDIYVEHWDNDKAEWGEPQNMGFPYSSPFNDYLFINTEDGKYSIFASDRDCPSDSVNIYVLEYEPNPIHSAVSDPEKLREMAGLNPPAAEKIEIPAAPSGNEPDVQTRIYMGKVAEVRACRRAVAEKAEGLERMREAYAGATAAEKSGLADALMEGEMALTSLRANLDKVSKELRDIEMDFLLNGVEIKMENDSEEPEPEASEVPAAEFKFEKKRFGAPLFVKFQ